MSVKNCVKHLRSLFHSSLLSTPNSPHPLLIYGLFLKSMRVTNILTNLTLNFNEYVRWGTQALMHSPPSLIQFLKKLLQVDEIQVLSYF